MPEFKQNEDELQVEIPDSVQAAIRRTGRSKDWENGVGWLLKQFKADRMRKLVFANDEKTLYRLQGEARRIDLILDAVDHFTKEEEQTSDE